MQVQHACQSPCRVVQKAAASKGGGIFMGRAERCNSSQYIPSSEAVSFPSALEIPRILLNRVQKVGLPSCVSRTCVSH